MAILFEAETELCNRHPIKDGLDGFLREFEPKFKSFSLSDFKALLHSDEAQDVTLRLISFLTLLPATSRLPSRHSSKHLGYDLFMLGSRVSSGSLNVEASAVLLERVINRSPDHDIWCAVYDLVTPATPPLSPRAPVVGVAETPFQFSSGTLHNTDEGRNYMDAVIENEMKDHIYLDLPALSKRVASQTLDSERNPKRSRSNTQGDSGNCNPLEDVARGRIHKRVIISVCGKQLYLARTRVGLLRGLIDGITGHENLLRQKNILHRDISIGSVLITEDESEGFLIDLDHAIGVDREGSPGAKGRTGTKVFTSIGLVDQNDDQSKRPHSFMDDLESMFWVLFWICVHYSDPSRQWVGSEYEEWNFRPPTKVARDKMAAVADEEYFLKSARRSFTDFYQPLVPWVNRLRREVFPGGLRWRVEDYTLYERMKVVLRRAMEDPAVMASSCS